MAAEVGWAGLGIVPTFDSSFDRDLARGLDPHLTRAGKSSGKRFGGVFGKAAALTAAGAVGAGFAAFKLGKDSIGLASDLNESLNAVNVSYGKQAGAVKRLGREAADNLGLSNTEFNSLSVRFSAFSKTIAGKDGKQVVTTLDDLTTRASDFASVMNLEVNEAAELFQSGLAGETEPLRKFGIDLSAAKVEAFAYAEGIAKQGEELTESGKVQARYGALMKQTAQTQGDFANTSDSLANKQRIMNARWDDARAKLGKSLLPIMEDVVGFVADEAIPKFEEFSDWFNAEGIPAIGDLADKVKPLAKELLPAAADAFGTVRDFAKDALPYAEGIVGAFNDMPGWAKKVLIGGVVGGLAAKKLGVFELVLGSKGGGLLGAVTKAKPLPVWVVNQGVGVPGDGPDGKPKGGSWLPKAAMTASLAVAVPLAAGWLIREMNEKTAPASPYETVNGIPDWYSNQPDGSVLGRQSQGAWRVPDLLPDTWEDTQALLDTSTRLRNLWNELPPEVRTHVTAPGLIDTHREVKDLIKKYDLGLDKRDVKTLYQLLGVDKAISDYDRIIAKQKELAGLVGHQVSLDTPGPGRSTQGGVMQGTGVQVNYHGPVTYTDDREGRRRAQQRARRSQTDGVPRGLLQ